MTLTRLMLAAFAAYALNGCAAQPATAPVAAASSSILVRSTPTAGAAVVGPVNELVLEFSPPALLNEVIVSGPDGQMPMMISPVGEQPRYVLPLSGLGTGAYRVSWRASAGGKEYRGDFAFTVK